MRTIAHIDSRRVWVHYLKTWILGSQPPRQFFPLLSIAFSFLSVDIPLLLLDAQGSGSAR